MLQITDVRIPLVYNSWDLKRAAARRLHIPQRAVREVKLVRRAVDARNRENIHYICTLHVDLDGGEARLGELGRGVKPTESFEYPLPKGEPGDLPPVIVGFGPAGMFAGLILAQCGFRPVIIERGPMVEVRRQVVENFWKTGELLSNANVQFGEGGAGTFSDGKLTTGTKDRRIQKVLEELVKSGAPREILVDARPHIGTDKLSEVVRAIRVRINRLGGQVLFNTKLEEICRDARGRVEGIRVVYPGGSYELPCDKLILATGHSARDVFTLLREMGVPMEARPFSVGVRIEHPQELIDRARYGGPPPHPALGPAAYKLFTHLPSGRGLYTFCMCPGGMVVGAASEAGGVVTNGMSLFARDGANANSALLVDVRPEDYGILSGEDAHSRPLEGVEFQRKIERAAFEQAGGSYRAPAQRLGDFLAGRASSGFGGVTPSYLPGVVPGEVDGCLPGFVTQALRDGIPILARQCPGFDLPDAVLTAPETRSTSPVRILRGKDYQSPGCPGLYPIGEGAGWAGGIVSAAVDGIKCAELIVTGRPWPEEFPK